MTVALDLPPKMGLLVVDDAVFELEDEGLPNLSVLKFKGGVTFDENAPVSYCDELSFVLLWFTAPPRIVLLLEVGMIV